MWKPVTKIIFLKTFVHHTSLTTHNVSSLGRLRKDCNPVSVMLLPFKALKATKMCWNLFKSVKERFQRIQVPTLLLSEFVILTKTWNLVTFSMPHLVKGLFHYLFSQQHFKILKSSHSTIKHKKNYGAFSITWVS